MNKNTLLAVILSALVLIAFSLIQGYGKQKNVTETKTDSGQTVLVQPSPQEAQPVAETAPPVNTSDAAAPASSSGSAASPSTTVFEQAYESPDAAPPQAEEFTTIETDLISVVLSNAGGDVVSWKLKNHQDGNEPVEMILSGNTQAHAFTVTFDNIENVRDGRSRPVSAFFYSNRTSDYSVEFYQDFIIPGANGNEDGNFRMTKRYEFKPGEYMFQLTIIMDGGHSVRGFNFNGASYTLAFGPQIGPRFEKLNQRIEYRQYLTYNKKKVKHEKINAAPNAELPIWAAIVGKYFAFIALPFSPQYKVAFSGQAEEGLPAASRMYICRSDWPSSRMDDRYLFYLGPKNTDNLNIYYNSSKNGFNLEGYQLSDAAKTQSFLSIPPLEKALKWFLIMFHKIIPNYGIAIILLTLLVKIIFFPLTRKSSEATQRMQTLSPKIKELQTKYKDNPQKMNAEMGELYKKEGYNPLSGCLPMLLQIPIFFAMYNLFNSHFDLRGAMFIPGWIPDLSAPEAIWTFPDGFKLPLLNWTALRALPFVYVGSQLIYSKVTQNPGQQSNMQMKMMLFVMPIVFFFILYDVPSGLLIYWIFSNLLTLVQQVIINKFFIPQKAAAAPEPVIAPKKKKKKGHF